MAKTMEIKILVGFLIVLGMWATQIRARSLSEESMSEKHEQWMARFGRVFEDIVEKERRFKIFKNNVESIEEFNQAGNQPHKLSINAFADLTNEEFRTSRNGLIKFPQKELFKTT
ncbi:hypothetical protein M9H77_04132 [Catharanthus roseus]|uniref:Uncharacterized protein n=1 Tax=Catharanthus roseus TaxID=4058 RepID=A0ACC0CDP0_CATRO|nr:hypothetical protein M9H77_04132 [Catharanthus roseus]